jgi:phenylalanyl-tRNA synthetase beta chain
MMLEVAGGQPSKRKVAGAPPEPRTVIAFSTALVEKLGGIKLGQTEILGTLGKLGFAVDGSGPVVTVRAPTWRPDIHGAADLVEEVVRIAGLDKVPSAPMPRTAGVARAVLTEPQRRVRRARRLLAARGMVEAVTWSFITRHTARAFGGGQDALELANPISTEMSSMRPSLLPGLLAAVQRNRNRGFADLALFEVGQAYRGDAPEDQFMAASGVRAGAAPFAGAGRHWSGAAGQAGVFDAKADVAALLAELGVDAGKAQLTRDAPAWFHPGRSGTLRLGPKIVLAHFGELHPETLRVLDVAAPVAAFEVFLGALPPQRRKGAARAALQAADLLPVRRDFAFVVDRDVAAGDVVKAALGVDRKLIAGANVFDVFEGGSLGDSKKSIALEVTLQPSDKTLTDREIEAVAGRIVAAVGKATGAEIRR